MEDHNRHLIHERLQDEYKHQLEKLAKQEKELRSKVKELRNKLAEAKTDSKIKDLEGKISHFEQKLESLAVERDKLAGDYAGLEREELPSLAKTESLFSFEGKNHAVEESKESDLIELKVDGKDTYYVDGFLYKELFRH